MSVFCLTARRTASDFPIRERNGRSASTDHAILQRGGGCATARKAAARNFQRCDSGYLWRVSVRRSSLTVTSAALLIATLGGGCTFELGEVKDPVEVPCEEGFASCEGEPACSANLSTSPDHCGACGRSCQGGSCTNGRCPMQTLTTVGTLPYGIAIDDTHVYYTDRDEGVLRKLPKAGGAPEVLAMNQGEITFVAVDPGTEGFVYFTRNGLNGGVSKVPKNHGAVVTLASIPFGWELAIDETNVYFTTGGPENPPPGATGSLQRVAKTGGAAVRLAVTSAQPGSIALDDTSIYFNDKLGKTVNRLDKSGPSVPEEIANSQAAPDGIAIDGDKLFWTCFDGDTVVVLSRQTSQSRVLASLQESPNGIVAGGNFAYYSTYQGNTIGRVSADGGPPLILANVDTPIRLALDDQYVYFTGNGEETMGPHGVYRVPR